MSRINIEDQLFADPRFSTLVNILGEPLAIGYFIMACRLAQKFWVHNKQLIPQKIWEHNKLPNALIDVELAEVRKNGIYIKGSSRHFSWIVKNRKNGAKGGQKTRSLWKAHKITDVAKGECSSDALNSLGAPTPTPTPTNNIYIVQIQEVIDYLNKKLKSRYRATSKKTIKSIESKLKEGFSVEDFKTVIDKKYLRWKDNQEMSQYLRPQTLFSDKFEDYLNEMNPFKETEGKLKNLMGVENE